MLNTNLFSKEQVNNAIHEVLFYQFKKDAKEAHKIVEQAGYHIVKGTGRYEIYNPITDRRIWLEYQGRYTAMEVVHHNYNWHKLPKSDHFDYVGCLDKPANNVWRDMTRSIPRNKVSSSHIKYRELRDKKYDVAMADLSIRNIKDQMERLQNKLVEAASYKAYKEQELISYRKEIGLL